MQNGRVAAFTVSELLRENQQGVKLRPPPKLGLKIEELRRYMHRKRVGLIVTGQLCVYLYAVTHLLITLYLRLIPKCVYEVIFDN